MIIELHSPTKQDILFTAWEIPEYAWEKRKEIILEQFSQYFKLHKVHYSLDYWQENIIFHIENSLEFKKTEKNFDDYFNKIKVVNIVN